MECGSPFAHFETDVRFPDLPRILLKPPFVAGIDSSMESLNRIPVGKPINEASYWLAEINARCPLRCIFQGSTTMAMAGAVRILYARIRMKISVPICPLYLRS